MKGAAMASASPTALRAKKAAWISLFTFGFGGLFWAGHWFYGLFYAGMQFFMFVMIFFGIGLIFFPLLWLIGAPMTYCVVRQGAMLNMWLRQVDEAEIRSKLAGSGDA
jgi:hypothetical protein